MISRRLSQIGHRPDGRVLRVLPAAVGLLGLLWSFVAIPPGAAYQAPDGVNIRVSADPQVATVGDLIRIDILVTVPKGYAVQVPDPGRRIAEFDVLEFLPGPDVPRDEGETAAAAERAAPSAGTTVHRARVVAALYRTGEFDFPALQIVVRDPAGKESTVSSAPVRVQIKSVLAAGDQQPKDPRKQADIPEPFRWRLWLVALAGLLAIFAAIGWLRRRTGAPVAPAPAAPQMMDPLEAAEAALRALLDSRLLEKGRVKQFYVSLADVVKQMLEAAYGIQALEKTSLEILEELRLEAAHRPRGRELEEIAGLMAGCDMVKFARYIPGEQENGAAVESAFRILEACKRTRSAPPAPLLESVPETS